MADNWTAKQIKKLQQRWHRDSVASIARLLNKTENQIRHKARRIGLPLSGRVTVKTIYKPKKKREKLSGANFLSLRKDQCRFPVSEDDGALVFCENAIERKSYCCEHYNTAYRKWDHHEKASEDI